MNMLDKVRKQKIYSIDEVPAAKGYLDRIGAKVTSMRVAKIQYKVNGYVKDGVVIKFSKDGSVSCDDPKYAPDENEIADIKDEIGGVLWPSILPITRLDGNTLPEAVRSAHPRDVYTFLDPNTNQIIMLQTKTMIDGVKHYFNWTHWDDNKWRPMSPDDGFPLWGAERLKTASTVFLHEGAKAARYCHELITLKTPQMLEALANHPWAEHLQNACHVGWIGGAHNPHLTDWEVFKKHNIRKVIIVVDNDDHGRSAVPIISKGLNIPTMAIEFNSKWPVSFDLADDFPEKLFSVNPDTGSKMYKGPTFEECLSNATWATDEKLRPDGRKKFYTVREAFRNQWVYVTDAERFVCVNERTIIWPEKQLNAALTPFSHVADTARLINKNFSGTHHSLCYDPSTEDFLVHYKGKPSVNVFLGSKVKPLQGSILPWLEYMRYLFPIEAECNEVLRWCATLIARPDIRIGYGLLLVSVKQGIGKTTLGTFVLPPLIGSQNYSCPSASMIVETNFTSWLAKKRLVVVDEVYQGSSWKAYNKLKAAITDPEVMINEKNVKEYVTDNWAHFIACSNSPNPLRVEDSDRRWFYPEMTETPWPGYKFKEFRHWLVAAGHRIILQWALDFENYIGPEERAPMTNKKEKLIEDSRSEATANIIDLVEAIATNDGPVALAMKDVYSFVRQNNMSKSYDTDRGLRVSMLQKGGIVYDKQLKINGKLQEVLINQKLKEGLKTDDHEGNLRWIRNYLTTTSNFTSSQERDIM